MLAFLVSAIRLGMTFLFGSTGETITDKSGHWNLGIPGVMWVGAPCGCVAEFLSLFPHERKRPPPAAAGGRPTISSTKAFPFS